MHTISPTEADGFIAVFSNENANIAVCAIVFSSLKQAQDWAREDFKRNGWASIKLDRTGLFMTALSGIKEGTFNFLPCIKAEDNARTSDISHDHLFSIR